jgi:hypothetical protein
VLGLIGMVTLINLGMLAMALMIGAVALGY